jgi:hypothetical protein
MNWRFRRITWRFSGKSEFSRKSVKENQLSKEENPQFPRKKHEEKISEEFLSNHLWRNEEKKTKQEWNFRQMKIRKIAI